MGTPLKQVSFVGLQTMPEVKPGDDIARLILESCLREHVSLEERNVIVITSKIVSKAENRIVNVQNVVPTRRARALSKLTGKDPIEVEMILRESTGVSAVIPIKKIRQHYPTIFENLSSNREAMDETVSKVPSLLVTTTKQGVLATDAGLDYSNNPQDTASLLPSNPNASAIKIRNDLERLTGLILAIVITDTEISFTNVYGSTEISIGYSGIRPVSNNFGSKDRFDRKKFGGADVIVDEIACAAGLLTGQTSEGIPVVILKGLEYEKSDDASRLVFPQDALRKGIWWTVISTLRARLLSRIMELFV